MDSNEEIIKEKEEPVAEPASLSVPEAQEAEETPEAQEAEKTPEDEGKRKRFRIPRLRFPEIKWADIKKRIRWPRSLDVYWGTLLQLTIMFVVFWAIRFVFYFYNQSMIGELPLRRLLALAYHGIQFDLAILAELNCLFILLRMLPFNFVYKRKYILATNILFVVVNSLALLSNMVDVPFYHNTGTRMRWSILKMLFSDSSIWEMTGRLALVYWGVSLLAIALIVGTMWLCLLVKIRQPKPLFKKSWIMYTIRSILFVGVMSLDVFLAHGDTVKGKLIIKDASNYAESSPEISLIINGPFSIIRGTEEIPYPDLHFFTDEELASLRNSVHYPAPGTVANKKNVVVIVMESGGSYWSDKLRIADNIGNGNMPFLNELVDQSYAFKNTMACSTCTIDGITTLFGGFPCYDLFLFNTSSLAGNTLDSPARLLSNEGYDTKFYYGGYPKQFFIDFFLRGSGFNDVTNSKTLEGKFDDDGMWGIWDHLFLPWAASDMQHLKEPFFAGVLTLNPHGPYKLPDMGGKLDFRYNAETVERSAQYTDYALRRFFETARQYDWYDNTVFILVGDHGRRFDGNPPASSPYVQSHILFLVFDPSGGIQPGVDEKVVSQFDVTPTIFGLVYYDKPYVSVGEDMFSPNHKGYAMNMINEQYQFISDRYVVWMSKDLENIKSVYDIRADKYLNNPLDNYDEAAVDDLVTWGRALLQDLGYRMRHNKISYERE